MNYNRHFALVLCFFIVLLPIASAQELTLQKYSGRKGINGIVGRDDILEVAVIASLPSTIERGDITPDQVRLRVDEFTFLFDKCERTGAAFTCKYNISLEGFIGRDEYAVLLLSDEGQETTSKKFTIMSDVLAPKIESFTISPQLTTEGQVQFNYKASDTAFNPNDATTCSGIKEVQFASKGQALLTDTADKTCRKENILTYNKQTTTQYEKTEICAKAIDVSGLASTPACKTLIIDKSPPEPTGMVLTDKEGFTLTHLRTGETRQADIIITISSNELDIVPESVIADFSSIAPGQAPKRFDDTAGDLYVWRNVPITTPSNCRIRISAVDLAGNTANKELTCTLSVDDTGPEPASIQTITAREGIPVFGANGTITADFKEAGIGMSSAKAFLDMRNFGLGIQKANKCTPITADLWRCFWNAAPQISGVRTVSVIDTKDDLGNTAGTLEQEIEADITPPTVSKKLQLSITHTGGEEYGAITIAGDTISVVATGNGIDNAIGNFTGIGGGTEQVNCGNEKTQKCTFSSPVLTSGPYNATLNFDFLDAAGNYVRLNFTHPVSSIADEENPNYWTVSTPKCSPALIDRSTASITAMPVFCQLRLRSTNANAEPVITSLPDITLCTGSGIDQGIITDINLINNGLGKTDPILSLSIGPSTINVNDINLNCQLNIHTRVGDHFTTNPEKENVSVKLEFYNLPLGELSSNVDKQIDDAIDDAKQLGDWIGTVDKVIEYSGKICSIKSGVNSVIAAADSVVMTLGAIGGAGRALGLEGFGKTAAETGANICNGVSGPLNNLMHGSGREGEGLIGGAGERLSANIGGEKVSLFNVLEKFCLFATCRLGPSEGKMTASASNFIQDSGAFFGGGVNWCQNVQDVLAGGLTGWPTEEGKPAGPLSYNPSQAQGVARILREQGVSGETVQQQVENAYVNSGGVQHLVDVKESIIWSTVCLCVPGIFHNLNKLRQIECKKATCIAQDVKEKGIPLSFCRDSYNQQTCKFWYGEIFMLFPLVQVFDQFMNMFKEAFANPFAAVGLVSGCLCGGCKQFATAPIVAGGASLFDLCDQATGLGETLIQYGVCVLPKTAARIGDAVASIQGLTDKKQWDTGTDWCDEMEEIESERNSENG
ncbi:MAG: hypothetical protein HY363_01805 [Candidatus Aenigmarchaeota archaeon]|nr:hypothetical protein [Candidatus Aenigmarchaeota archaeon]